MAREASPLPAPQRFFLKKASCYSTLFHLNTHPVTVTNFEQVEMHITSNYFATLERYEEVTETRRQDTQEMKSTNKLSVHTGRLGSF